MSYKMSVNKSGWADPRRQSDLLEALLTAANLPSNLSPDQRDAVISFLHSRGHTEVNWNGLR